MKGFEFCLKFSQHPVKGEMAFASGWGKKESFQEDYYGTHSTNHLYYVQVPLMTNSECKTTRHVQYIEDISPNVVCAGYPEPGKTICKGDSGGPLVVRKGINHRLLLIICKVLWWQLLF